MADEAAVEVRGAEQPVGDGEGEVHVHLHHQPGIVVSGVVPAQGVHERAVAHEGVLLDVAAEVHELVDEIHAGGHAHEQPAHVGREQEAQHHGGRDRHQDEDDQRIGRKHGDAPVLVVAEAHLVVGEELVVVERVALIDRAQPFDVHRPVHDVSVHGPLEQVGEQEGERDGEPLAPGHVVDVLDVDVEGRRSHRVDQDDVEVAVVPAQDAGAVFLTKIDLPLTDHRVSPRSLPLSCALLAWLPSPAAIGTDISHIYITARAPVQSPAGQPPRRVPPFR